MCPKVAAAASELAAFAHYEYSEGSVGHGEALFLASLPPTDVYHYGGLSANAGVAVRFVHPDNPDVYAIVRMADRGDLDIEFRSSVHDVPDSWHVSPQPPPAS